MIDTGDNAWILTSSAMVLLMTPGLAFFYAGLAGRTNVVATIMHSFIIVALISVVWVLWGYSLAFGPDLGHIIGNFSWFGLKDVGVDPNTDYAGTIPHLTFMSFQMMFAIITPALVTGALVGRLKFRTFLVFIVLWSTLVYVPIAHWVWGIGGWLGNLNLIGLGVDPANIPAGYANKALDYAGGTVVHISSGVSALAAALVLGKRRSFGQEPDVPHNIPFVVLGVGLLWFGWFGFNAGSALAANGAAANAFVTTNTAAAAAALAWMTMSWWRGGAPSLVGAASGAVVGLVAITPAAGWVSPMSAILIGIGAGVFCYLAARLRQRAKVDDSLDVWACHGVGGTWGALATGLFATAAVGGVNGLFYGNPGQLVNQIVAVLASWVWAFVVTFIILKVLDKTMGLRVSEQQEAVGLDISQHGEPAYTP
ncbi:MAG: ammonium transporter, partial [Dehalococcoidia bacterium]|nr:ammonium transporter [Dehalococcoidia bacterium]